MTEGREACGAHKKGLECAFRPDRLKDCTDPSHRCGQGRGRGTSHPGTGPCRYHAGNTRNHRVAGARVKAQAGIRALIAAPSVRDVLDVVDRGALTGDAKAALREMLAVALWREQAVRVTAQREDGALYGPTRMGDAREHVLWSMHGEAVKATAVIAKMLTDQQTDDDYVELERAKLRTVADALEGALSDVGLPIPARDAVLRAFGRRLTPIATSGPGSQN